MSKFSSNLEMFQEFLDQEKIKLYKLPSERVHSRGAEYLLDAMLGSMYRDPEEYREWLSDLIECFYTADMGRLGDLLFTTVYKDITQSYHDGYLDYLDGVEET